MREIKFKEGEDYQNSIVTLEVKECVRCGKTHNVIFYSTDLKSYLPNQKAANYDYWGVCENTNKLVYMNIEEKE